MPSYSDAGTFDCYVPRILLSRLTAAPTERVVTREGTALFIDVSGFTRLSERLARIGREGAEHLTDAINTCFSALLADAYANGGALLKFGGDALLLWFEGEDHPQRACASACAMRGTLRSAGRITTGAGRIGLRMSAGVHSGAFDMFLVGSSHREFIIAGPATSRVVEMEGAASVGQILVSPDTAARLSRRALGSPCGPGVLLSRSPSLRAYAPQEVVDPPSDEAIAQCLSTEIRAHVMSAPAAPEHRTVTVAFIQFGGLDTLIAGSGRDAVALALDELVCATQEAADLFQVCFLGSDVAGDGGKLILAAGAPRAVGDDEERMLLTLRHVIEHPHELPIRIGVNRGQVFAGEIGPHYRRTYSVMGDTVNLAARLMAKAPWHSIYATPSVLERSQTKFESTRLEPFMVKGKERPIEAWAVGAIARPTGGTKRTRLPLIGRDQEHARLRQAVEDAQGGRGVLIELVGETGSGKSRLLTEAQELGAAMRFLHATCETYTQTVPYIIWRDILRQLLGVSWHEEDDVVIAAVQEQIDRAGGELRPWLPLIAVAVDVDVPTTREVEDLAEDFRATKLHEVVLRFIEPWLATPTLLQVEHAHLMDAASAGLMRRLAERVAESRWVIAITRREFEAAFVADDAAAVRLELGPLDHESSLRLAEASPHAELLPPHVLELAVERAGGSPEFLLDLLVAAASGSGVLPDSLEAAASARLDLLDPSDRLLVRRAAVFGLSFDAGRLPIVLEGETPNPDERAWSRLAPVFARDPEGHVRFKRPALREVAYEGLPFRVRRRLHGEVARALEQDVGRDVDANPAVLSLHFHRAGAHQRAWTYARMAAEGAAADYAHADAAELYRRAIEAGRQAGASAAELAACSEGLAEALRRSGELSDATAALADARRYVHDDPLALGRLFHRHVILAHLEGKLPAAVRWGGRGLRAVETESGGDAAATRARLLAELAFVRYRQGRLPDAERLCRAAIEQSEAVGEQRGLAQASHLLDAVLLELGRGEEAIHSPLALEIYERLGEAEDQGNVLNFMAASAYFGWEWDEALRLYALAAECYRRAGNPTAVATAEGNIGEILADRGCYDEALGQLERARRIMSATGFRPGAANQAVLLGRIAVRMGEQERGRALIREASQELMRLGEKRYATFALAVLAEAEAFFGDADGGALLATSLLETVDRELPLCLRARGVALARLGERDRAVRELEASLAVAREQMALYDIAATVDVLEAIAPETRPPLAERDAILERLQVERLPEVALEPPTVNVEPAAAQPALAATTSP